jgi:hypothetical protein
MLLITTTYTIRMIYQTSPNRTLLDVFEFSSSSAACRIKTFIVPD